MPTIKEICSELVEGINFYLFPKYLHERNELAIPCKIIRDDKGNLSCQNCRTGEVKSLKEIEQNEVLIL